VSATELRIDHARPFIDVTLGADRVASAWLDTGGGPLIVGSRLADGLGLVEFDDVVDGQPMRRVDLRDLAVAGSPLLTAPYVARRSDADLIAAGFDAELFIPAHVLAAHTVVFDYPARRFELHAPGDATGRGEAVPCPFRRRPGWPAVHARIGPNEVPMLLDTGASCCMLSLPEFERVTAALPPERKATGAVGIANMSGGAWEATVAIARVPMLAVGPLEVPEAVLVARPQGNFERMMSSGTSIPVVGAISGNVLRWARIELYSTPDVAYIDPADAHPADDDMTLVPLVMQATVEGPVIQGVASRNGTPLVTGLIAGDRLMSVDGEAAGGLRFSEVVGLLRGEEGQTKTLQIRREGAFVEVVAPVVRVL
jgi:hypothetical protein